MAGRLHHSGGGRHQDEDHNPLVGGGKGLRRNRRRFGGPGGNPSMGAARQQADDTIGNVDDVLNDDPYAEGAVGAHPNYEGSPNRVLGDMERSAVGPQPQQSGPAKPNPSITRGGLGTPLSQGDNTGADNDGQSAGGLRGLGREMLQKLEEQAGLYKDEAIEYGKKEGKNYLMEKFQVTKRLWIWGTLAGLFGGSFALILLSVMAGPMQFIHLERSLQDYHFAVQETQTGFMALKLSRNINQVANGERQKTYLGVAGNTYADRLQENMSDAGFKSDFRSGAWKGWIVDSQKLDVRDYPGMKSTKPADVQSYFEERGLKSTISGDTLRFAPSGKALSYFQDLNQLRRVLKVTKASRMTPIAAHFYKGRLQYTLNPGRKWIQDKDNKILAAAEKKTKFFLEERKYARTGVTATTLPIDAERDKNGNTNGNQDAASDTQKLIDERNAALAEFEQTGDASKLNAFRNSIAGRLGAGSIGIIGVLCFAQAMAHLWDVVVETQIAQPMMRMALKDMSRGSANEQGGEQNVSEDFNAMSADLYYDEKTGTNVMDACGLQYESGRGPTKDCIDVPDTAKIDPNGNFLSRFLDIEILNQACSTTGQIVIFLVSTALLGPLKTFVDMGIGVAAGLAVNAIAEHIMTMLLANQVPGDSEGALRGGFDNMGAFLAANQNGLNGAAVPLQPADSAIVKVATRSISEEEFKQKNLAYRLFDANDPRSVFAQVLDNQAPDPAQNMAHTASGLLNITRNFGATLFRPFMSKANAQWVSYDYGRTLTAFLPQELNSTDPTVENPYVNADIVADELDAQAASGASGIDSYITRAKTCFGVGIVKKTATTKAGESYEQYTLAPPDDGSMPMYKDVMNPDNKCAEGYGNPTHPWTRVRLYIKASMTMNAWACGMNLNTVDPIAKQACIDIGQEPNPAAAQSSAPSNGSLGVGGIPTANCSAPNVRCLTADSAAEITDLKAGQTLECQGHKVPRIVITGSNITVQNCVVSGGSRDGIDSQGANNTIQNNDISNIGLADDDINGVTFFGNGTKVLNNKVHDLVRGSPGGSHTDCIQTWATPSKNASADVTIQGNWCEGPDASNPGYLHQCIMAEGPKSNDGGGGGSGVSSNWMVAGNYCKTYGNQAMKFDDIHNVTITKNTFAGNASKVVERMGSAADDVKFLPDNIITGTYGQTAYKAPAKPNRVVAIAAGGAA